MVSWPTFVVETANSNDFAAARRPTKPTKATSSPALTGIASLSDTMRARTRITIAVKNVYRVRFVELGITAAQRQAPMSNLIHNEGNPIVVAIGMTTSVNSRT